MFESLIHFCVSSRFNALEMTQLGYFYGPCILLHPLFESFYFHQTPGSLLIFEGSSTDDIVVRDSFCSLKNYQAICTLCISLFHAFFQALFSIEVVRKLQNRRVIGLGCSRNQTLGWLLETLTCNHLEGLRIDVPLKNDIVSRHLDDLNPFLMLDM